MNTTIIPLTMPEPPKVASNEGPSRLLNELMDEYDRQSAVEAHAVYRVDGKPVCVVARNGEALFDTVEDFRAGGGQKPSDEASTLGLTGEQYMEYVAREIAQHLKQRYSDALEIAHYETGAAPAVSEVREEMFGITRERWRILALSATLGLSVADLPSGVLVTAKN